MANFSNGRSCDTCCKFNVCKYSDEVQKAISNLKTLVEGDTLPLYVNVNCYEHMADVNNDVRGML